MKIIGITGTLGAGKGTVVEYLVKNKNYNHYSVGEFLNKELTKRGIEINRPNMADIANELRTKFGPSYITQELFKLAKENGKNAIIESIRNPKEAEFIKNNGGKLIAIDADQKIRYERITKRGSKKDGVSFKEFQKQEEKESQNSDPNAQNLPKCIAMSDTVIYNDVSIEELYEKVEEFIGKKD